MLFPNPARQQVNLNFIIFIKAENRIFAQESFFLYAKWKGDNMKGTVKLKKRLEALGLALLFMLQSVLGFLPGMIFSAAGAVKSIEVWDSDQLIDYGYRFNMKFQPGVTTYESFGCDNLDSAAFSDHGRSTRDTESVRITEDYKLLGLMCGLFQLMQLHSMRLLQNIT